MQRFSLVSRVGVGFISGFKWVKPATIKKVQKIEIRGLTFLKNINIFWTPSLPSSSFNRIGFMSISFNRNSLVFVIPLNLTKEQIGFHHTRKALSKDPFVQNPRERHMAAKTSWGLHFLDLLVLTKHLKLKKWKRTRCCPWILRIWRVASTRPAKLKWLPETALRDSRVSALARK